MGTACPACGSAALGRHARYAKYHRDTLISIVRVRCVACGTTHALMPSFSLPGSSHDSADVEGYLAARESGLARREAGARFLDAGRDLRTLKRIERTFRRCLLNWSAVFAVAIDMAHAVASLGAVVGAEGGILLAANRHALGRGVNAFFASRSSSLVFRSAKAGRMISHNPDSPRPAPEVRDSS